MLWKIESKQIVGFVFFNSSFDAFIVLLQYKCAIFALTYNFIYLKSIYLFLIYRSNRMNKQKRFLLSLTLLISLIGTAVAQQVGVNSPYGRYGYGLLSNQSVGST